MTHAEEIATIRRNHREDLQLIFGEIKSVNKSVTRIETEMDHLVCKEDITGIVHAEMEAVCARNHAPKRKDWQQLLRSAVFFGMIGSAIVGTAITTWYQIKKDDTSVKADE